jgi:glycosyltransferase involved in cell wall biosynthesis
MRVAILTTDNREPGRQYQLNTPFFGTAPEALLQGFAKNSEIEVHVLSCSQRRMTSPEKLASNIFFHSLEVPKLGWMKTCYLGCIQAIRKKLRQIQPTVVHGQGTERDCSISAVFSGFPNVLTIHGNMRAVAAINHAPPLSFLWLAGQLERFTLPRTDGVICVSNYTRHSVEKLVKKTWLVPNAVNEEFFDVEFDLNPQKPIVGLCIGTICYHKNQNNFIRALDSLAARRKFKIIFFGGMSEDKYGLEFQQLLKNRPWCEYGGWAERERLKDLFKAASFVALPSLEDNCPMVVLEAMAAGLPVIASHIGGIPDLIEANKTGFLCDPQHAESFSIAVGKIIDYPESAMEMGIYAKLESVAKFDPTIIADRHIEIYREIAATRS